MSGNYHCSSKNGVSVCAPVTVLTADRASAAALVQLDLEHTCTQYLHDAGNGTLPWGRKDNGVSRAEN
jgi:hypothetical protein